MSDLKPLPSTPQRYDFTIHTYGCKVNTYDTGLLQNRLTAEQERAVSEKPAAAAMPKVHILNTCAVTAEATREAVKQVRRLKSKDPLAKIVVTGCGAQVDGLIFDDLPGVDLVVANSHKGSLERLLDTLFKGELKERVFRSNIFRKDDLEAGGGVEANHTRTFLKIQDGCNSFCTYCVIPFARGKSRSLPVAELITRVRELHLRGVNEVVLTGVHIGDYEDVLGGRTLALSDLVSSLLKRTEIPRLRLSSLEPVELTSELLALYQNPRLCAHFHMSIQSANSRVLSAMRRHYDAGEVERALLRIQEQVPGAFVGMDVIAGFPGETEDEFADTYRRLEALPWTRLHVFPYSERPGTKAASYPDSVPRHVRALRSQRLRDLSAGRFASVARAQVGQIKEVILLKAPGRGAEGLTRDYWPLKFVGLGSAELSPAELHHLSELAGQEVKAEVVSYRGKEDLAQMSRMDGLLCGRLLETSFAGRRLT